VLVQGGGADIGEQVEAGSLPDPRVPGR
jgi:hypothetical protein